MNLSVFGAGYVGLVTSACFADAGNQVLCVDSDQHRIAQLLSGHIPIHEPALSELIGRNMRAGRLDFTTDPRRATELANTHFITVGTPLNANNTADTSQVLHVAREIGRHMREDTHVVIKSTVPVGTADAVEGAIRNELKLRGAEGRASVSSNPEFLKEGSAVSDFLNPTRVIVGTHDDRVAAHLRALYSPFFRHDERFIQMNRRSAELTKYAANAMLATRISFINEFANLAQALGADIDMVRHGMGCDPRIGSQYLDAGCGYGGSCLPKDVQAIIAAAAREAHLDMPLLRAVDTTNTAQKRMLVQRITRRFGADLRGRHFALWGLAFKPHTDDIRDAPSLVVIHDLIAAGATICAYDPVAAPQAQRAIGALDGLRYAASAMGALVDADALVIATAWEEFFSPDFATITATLKQPAIFDGRHLYNATALRDRGIEYFAIGCP